MCILYYIKTERIHGTGIIKHIIIYPAAYRLHYNNIYDINNTATVGQVGMYRYLYCMHGLYTFRFSCHYQCIQRPHSASFSLPTSYFYYSGFSIHVPTDDDTTIISFSNIFSPTTHTLWVGSCFCSNNKNVIKKYRALRSRLVEFKMLHNIFECSSKFPCIDRNLVKHSLVIGYKYEYLCIYCECFIIGLPCN